MLVTVKRGEGDATFYEIAANGGQWRNGETAAAGGFVIEDLSESDVMRGILESESWRTQLGCARKTSHFSGRLCWI